MESREYLDTVTVNADGTVEGMEDAMKRALRRYPYLTFLPDVVDDDEAYATAEARRRHRSQERMPRPRSAQPR